MCGDSIVNESRLSFVSPHGAHHYVIVMGMLLLFRYLVRMLNLTLVNKSCHSSRWFVKLVEMTLVSRLQKQQLQNNSPKNTLKTPKKITNKKKREQANPQKPKTTKNANKTSKQQQTNKQTNKNTHKINPANKNNKKPTNNNYNKQTK